MRKKKIFQINTVKKYITFYYYTIFNTSILTGKSHKNKNYQKVIIYAIFRGVTEQDREK